MVAHWSSFQWTQDRVDILRKLWPKQSASQIAMRLGNISRNAVIGKAHRLGLVCSPRNPRDKAERAAQTHRVRKAAKERKQEAPMRMPKFKPDPEALAALRAIPDTPTVKSLLDLEPHHCRWPCGEPTDGFCGEKHIPGLPYCERHSQRAYVAVERKRDSILKPKVSAAPWNAKRFLINA